LSYGGGVIDPRSADFTVQHLAAARHDDAVAALARAFWPDPLFGFFNNDKLKEYGMLPKVFQAFVADAAPFDRTWGAFVGDRVVGAAVWVPPGGMPRTARREAMMQVRVGRLLITGQNRRIGLKLLEEVDKVHPAEPHWYLALLGTDPVVQGRGVATAMLAPAVAQADMEGLPCYLETQKEENLAFYGRHGFDLLHTISVPGSPTVWGMRRAPK
jgi:GNAT superfamily N-acetyltransferase